MDSKLTVGRLSSNPEVSHRLGSQIRIFKDAIMLDERRKQKLFDHVLEVIKKLDNVKYHHDNLIRIVSKELAERNTSKGPRAVTEVVSNSVEKEPGTSILGGRGFASLSVTSALFVSAQLF